MRRRRAWRLLGGEGGAAAAAEEEVEGAADLAEVCVCGCVRRGQGEEGAALSLLLLAGDLATAEVVGEGSAGAAAVLWWRRGGELDGEEKKRAPSPARERWAATEEACQQEGALPRLSSRSRARRGSARAFFFLFSLPEREASNAPSLLFLQRGRTLFLRDAAARAEVGASVIGVDAVTVAGDCATATTSSEALLRAWDIRALLTAKAAEPLSWTPGILRGAIVFEKREGDSKLRGRSRPEGRSFVLFLETRGNCSRDCSSSDREPRGASRAPLREKEQEAEEGERESTEESGSALIQKRNMSRSE